MLYAGMTIIFSLLFVLAFFGLRCLDVNKNDKDKGIDNRAVIGVIFRAHGGGAFGWVISIFLIIIAAVGGGHGGTGPR